MIQQAQLLIDKLKLEPHPEGGYFAQTYESEMRIEIPGYDGPRHICSAIYYMLVGDRFSSFHRIKSDELWHFYSGSSLTLHVITRNGKLREITMGSDIRSGQRLQAIVEGGTWFAASVNDTNSYSLIGCTVSPGFDYGDFELAKKKELLKSYPQHEAIIQRFTR